MSEAPSPPSPQPAGISPLRIVLFGLLAIAVMALAFDWAARWRANHAYGQVDALLNEEDIGEQDLSGAMPRTPSELHKLLGREPNARAQGKDDMRETYAWRGVFKTYSVHLVYSGATLNLEKPEESEPLLTKVGFMAPPE